MSQPNQPPVTPNSMPGANPQMAQPVSTEPPPPSQEAPKEAAPQQLSTQQEPATAQQPEGDEKEPTDWKAHAKTWEGRAAANQAALSEAQKKAKQWDDHQATLRTKEENDRIALQERDARIAQLEREALVNKIAVETGVPPSLLGGGTEEELRAAAAQALEWRGPGQQEPPKPQTSAVSASAVTSSDKLGHAPNQVQQLTREQFAALQPAERMAAVRSGQCADLGIGVPKQQRRMGNQLELGAHAAQQR